MDGRATGTRFHRAPSITDLAIRVALVILVAVSQAAAAGAARTAAGAAEPPPRGETTASSDQDTPAAAAPSAVADETAVPRLVVEPDTGAAIDAAEARVEELMDGFMVLRLAAEAVSADVDAVALIEAQALADEAEAVMAWGEHGLAAELLLEAVALLGGGEEPTPAGTSGEATAPAGRADPGSVVPADGAPGVE